MAHEGSNPCPPCPALSWKKMCHGVGAARGKKARLDPINNTHDPSYVQGKSCQSHHQPCFAPGGIPCIVLTYRTDLERPPGRYYRLI